MISLIVVRYHIHSSKWRNQKPSLNRFKNEFKNVWQINTRQYKICVVEYLKIPLLYRSITAYTVSQNVMCVK